MLKNNIDDLALKQRRKWGIDSYSPLNVFSIALDNINNLTIQWLEMDQFISGCCSKNITDYLVLINSTQSKGRQNFTFAHELYHLLHEKSDGWIVCTDNINIESELNANNFASSLLMPDCALSDYIYRNNIINWNLRDMIKCEQFFQISHSHLLNRLKKEDLISLDEFKKFKLNVIKNSKKLGFDTELYEPSPSNKHFYSLGSIIPLTEEVFSKNKISKGMHDEIFIRNYRADIIYK